MLPLPPLRTGREKAELDLGQVAIDIEFDTVDEAGVAGAEEKRGSSDLFEAPQIFVVGSPPAVWQAPKCDASVPARAIFQPDVSSPPE